MTGVQTCALPISHLFLVFCQWQYNFHISLVGQRVVYELRKALHGKLQTLPLSFFDRIQTGKLLSVVLDDVGTIQQTVSTTAIQICTNSAGIIVGAILICAQNWRMGLLVLFALPFYVWNYRYFRPQIRDGNIVARRATASLYGLVEERVTAVRMVKVFGHEHSEVRRFVETVANLARVSMYIVRKQNVQTTIATTISSLATGVVLYLGLKDYQNGGMTLGDAMSFFAYAGFLFAPAVMLSEIISIQLQQISVVMRRAFDLMEAEPEPADRPRAIALAEAKGDIGFAHVTFTYPNDVSPTLRDVTFSVPAGKQVAIMGPSGSGKSTLLYLLMRFYDPSEGVITLDGHDLRDLKLLNLRERITLVMQEPVIFSGTMAENIRYGRLDASDEEVRRAAKDADLHEFIMSMPDSYETIVGERGMSLSGGQRQRLALAASLVSRPSVLLLDDTTSALDPATETRVRKTLNRLMQGRTCFVVTHRISTAMASDLVLMLDAGRLLQFGTPAALLGREGPFRRIYEQQQRESADDAVG